MMSFSQCQWQRGLRRGSLRPLACWELGFESRRRHGCFYLVGVVRCQVKVSASGSWLVQRSPTECDREASKMWKPWPTWGHCAMGGGDYLVCARVLVKSLVRPTSRCILFDDENILFDASLVLYIYIYIYTSNYDYKYDIWKLKSSVAVACFLPGRVKDLSAALYNSRNSSCDKILLVGSVECSEMSQ